MPATVTQVTEDRPALHPAICAAVAAVLAGVLAWRGYEMGQALRIRPAVVPLADLIPLLLGVSGLLGGAGLGLLLSDVRSKRTTTTTRTEETIGAQSAPSELITSAISVAKDLTAGKLLVVLAVALLGASLFAVSPDAEPTAETGRGNASQRS